ncbi:hypothetical protein, unknown function [Leishmania infantum JPCM5]|uniref:Uncharacterized protein n=2 Tax=Leishmania infantum TaxID=5671 RepID=A4HWU8_LEIIN|nr:hypothetical protein, unknown function [Leishmania infantum JPCM5]CAC9474710.1 hypothetical_protein_-_conserved [Leishmania infantum]CAM66929.1 hypothetical protein, unknown function [Leishmania infantum JPCM5]SUZ40628.1 hypothetical_protein_-_conserved [Leishmania infantum]|eukprot:XP_001464539.1 hypothetical protein, unknown function [Leishmania infantum JPCM5]
MLWCRFILLILMVLFTGCIIASILLPIFRKESNDTDMAMRRVFFWYNETVRTSDSPPEDLIMRFYTRNLLCLKARALFLLMSALSLMAAGVAVVVCLMLACWTTAGYSICISVTSLVLSIFAMLFSMVVLAASTVVFKQDFCVNQTEAYLQAPQKNGYRLVEGFFLLCIAVGGFLLMFITLVVCLCCECRSRSQPCGQDHGRKTDSNNLPNSGAYLSATHSS